MQILDGKKVSAFIKEDLFNKVELRKEQGEKIPHLAAILIGNDGASETYVNAKVKACNEIGFGSTLIRLSDNISEIELLDEINKLNLDQSIDGILVQLPLPAHISSDKVINCIYTEKDVDGFHPKNIGRMVQNMPGFLPATPKGILMLLEYYNIETKGKNAVVIGRSNIVGRPISILLSQNNKVGNCTVTICHSHTQNIKEICSNADIIIAALGKAEFVKKDWVKEGAIIIDVGITRLTDPSKKSGYSLKGDVAFDEVSEKASFITPVPGGVGPMTIAALMQNTYDACLLRQ